ncbi:MAG: hypothetical protein SF123_10270 [Chloroflexota bacterium]|nr:hypothetical protein [Chloroflexota bacterium]
MNNALTVMQMYYRQPPNERVFREQSPDGEPLWVVWRYVADLLNNEWCIQ